MKITLLKSKKNISFSILLKLAGLLFLLVFSITVFLNSINKHSLYNTALIPNVLEGTQAPKTYLPLLNNEGYLNSEYLKGRVTLINFWGSWCPPCRAEHPILMNIAKDQRFDLIGINYKDNKDHAQRFLVNFGNPFKFVGFDISGHTAIYWGVYALPETFLLNKEGIIIAKYTGPLTWSTYQNELLPKIEKLI
ncbi:DsbE family thiol:disulfide interchange protein [Bartonella sp. F02]|uniref:DsbE family thiol:disulfide interchange protein n=1 Tax=Bartonella sp. F02 TaxID=2967262 RepID=UPI0022A9EAC6|nr:DsbE family thiol:disulfide interchange protein [Bartonella sp. F02]MCZ2328024.1 DsbE family thiol:disulfide interchange protein [Bartonella sp. F02]